MRHLSATASLNIALIYQSGSHTYRFKRLLAHLTHISPFLVNQKLNLYQFCGNILLLIIRVALLFSDFPVNITIGVFKNVVSCNDDFFYVPTTWEKDTKTAMLFTKDGFT